MEDEFIGPKHPEQCKQAEPTAYDAIFSEMLLAVWEKLFSDAGGTTPLWRTSERGPERG